MAEQAGGLSVDFILAGGNEMEQVLLSQDGGRVLVKSQSYENENELQEIIKANPHLINLTSIFDSPFMIIGRESEHIDVLGITAHAVPVIIECKRKDNADMRYLIAQILEYASRLEQMTYNDFDQLVTNYLASSRCEEEQYKNLSLKEAFAKFKQSLTDSDESDELLDEDDFDRNLANNLENGEFYLVVVVDAISDPALRTIQFLNRKLKGLRIEVIEISKFGDTERKIYVPSHVNREINKEKSQPGKVTFDEMIRSCGQKEATFVKTFKESWEDNDDFSIKMGTKGFSARYRDVPVFYVFPTHFRIAPPIKKKFQSLFEKLMDLLESYFGKDLKVGVSFSSAKFNQEKIGEFIGAVKSLLASTEVEVPS